MLYNHTKADIQCSCWSNSLVNVGALNKADKRKALKKLVCERLPLTDVGGTTRLQAGVGRPGNAKFIIYS